MHLSSFLDLDSFYGGGPWCTSWRRLRDVETFLTVTVDVNSATHSLSSITNVAFAAGPVTPPPPHPHPQPRKLMSLAMPLWESWKLIQLILTTASRDLATSDKRRYACFESGSKVSRDVTVPWWRIVLSRAPVMLRIRHGPTCGIMPECNSTNGRSRRLRGPLSLEAEPHRHGAERMAFK